MRGSAVMRSSAAPTITAAARVAARLALCLRSEKKVIWPGAARSREPTCPTAVRASPATRPPSREAISPSVSDPGMASLRGRRLAAFEGLDHLVGDVDAGARVDRILENDVVLLLLRDLPDDAVRLLHHARQLLVAALVQVFPELALLALKVAVQIAELALLGAPLHFAH